MMNRIFDMDNPLWRFLGKLADLMILNILFLLCSIPIFTIGASLTGVYYVCLKIKEQEEGYIVRNFFKSFKQNFVQSTIIWLIMLVTGALIVADFVLLYRLRATSTGTVAVMWTLLLAVTIACSILYAIVLAYIFPLLSICSNTTPNMFKNAFLFGTHYLFVTILVFFIHYAMFFLVVNVFTPLIIFGEGLCAVITAPMLLKIIAPHIYDPNTSEDKESVDDQGEAET